MGRNNYNHGTSSSRSSISSSSSSSSSCWRRPVRVTRRTIQCILIVSFLLCVVLSIRMIMIHNFQPITTTRTEIDDHSPIKKTTTTTTTFQMSPQQQQDTMQRIMRLKKQQSKARPYGTLKELPPPPPPVVVVATNNVATTRQGDGGRPPPILPVLRGDKGSPRRDFMFRDPNAEKIFFFVHIHKSAGSSMCQMAIHNQLRTERYRNCNIQADLRCCGKEDSIQAQITFAKTSNYDFVAIEKEMYTSMTPEYYHYIIILRNSKLRYYSHYNHVQKEYYGSSSSRSSVVGGGTTTTTTTTSTISFVQWWTGQPDNWNTRIICGPPCLEQSPKYQITSKLFQYTLNRLVLFDDILFVETLEESYRNFTIKYGWSTDIPMSKINVNNNNNNMNVTTKLSIQQQDDWNPLMSALDDALYEFAQRKQHDGIILTTSSHPNSSSSSSSLWDQFSIPIQRQLDYYFTMGPLQNCTTICCSEECTMY